MVQPLLLSAIQDETASTGVSFAEIFLLGILGIILVTMAMAIPIFLAIALKPRQKRRLGGGYGTRGEPPASAWEESGRRTEAADEDEHMGNYG